MVIIFIEMSTQMNPQKPISSLHRANLPQNKNSHDKAPFLDKMKQIKAIIGAIVPEDRQRELLIHLEELSDIYQNETLQQKHKNQKAKTSELDAKNQESDSIKDKGKKNQKVMLEIREGNKLTNQFKIDPPISIKSPDKKVEEKKFKRFSPRKTAKIETTPTLGNILKAGLNI